MNGHDRNTGNYPAEPDDLKQYSLLRAEYENLPDVRKEYVERAKKKLGEGVYDKHENVRNAAVVFFECWSGS